MGTDFEKKNSNLCSDTADFASLPPYLGQDCMQSRLIDMCPFKVLHWLPKKIRKCGKIRKILIPISWSKACIDFQQRGQDVIILKYKHSSKHLWETSITCFTTTVALCFTRQLQIWRHQLCFTNFPTNEATLTSSFKLSATYIPLVKS